MRKVISVLDKNTYTKRRDKIASEILDSLGISGLRFYSVTEIQRAKKHLTMLLWI